MEELLKIVFGWLVEKALDWLLDKGKATNVQDAGIQRAIRRSIIGMIGSIAIAAFAIWQLVDIAALPSVNGAQAVAAALGVGLVIVCAITYKRRREQWKHCRKLADGKVIQATSSSR